LGLFLEVLLEIISGLIIGLPEDAGIIDVDIQ
jgi:hypothetical protein